MEGDAGGQVPDYGVGGVSIQEAQDYQLQQAILESQKTEQDYQKQQAILESKKEEKEKEIGQLILDYSLIEQQTIEEIYDKNLYEDGPNMVQIIEELDELMKYAFLKNAGILEFTDARKLVDTYNTLNNLVNIPKDALRSVFENIYKDLPDMMPATGVGTLQLRTRSNPEVKKKVINESVHNYITVALENGRFWDLDETVKGGSKRRRRPKRTNKRKTTKRKTSKKKKKRSTKRKRR